MSRPEAVRRHAASFNSLRPTPAQARNPTLPDLKLGIAQRESEHLRTSLPPESRPDHVAF